MHVHRAVAIYQYLRSRLTLEQLIRRPQLRRPLYVIMSHFRDQKALFGHPARHQPASQQRPFHIAQGKKSATTLTAKRQVMPPIWHRIICNAAATERAPTVPRAVWRAPHAQRRMFQTFTEEEKNIVHSRDCATLIMFSKMH